MTTRRTVTDAIVKIGISAGVGVRCNVTSTIVVAWVMTPPAACRLPPAAAAIA